MELTIHCLAGKCIYSKEQGEAVHYASVDDLMYLTPEEDWKEIKLGRIFKASDIVQVNEKKEHSCSINIRRSFRKS